MLDRIVREKLADARRRSSGCGPPQSVGDDVEVYADDARRKTVATLRFLRQQADKPPGPPGLLPRRLRRAEGVAACADWIGAFAVTAGIGIEAHVARFEAEHDDYNAILLKALADRLAEALAEAVHRRVRRELWGYAPDEALDNDALIAEEYRGIRPAPGYPACPDHTEKGDAVRAARRARARRRDADRELRDAPGGGRVGLLLLAPRFAVLRASAASRASRSRTTRSARAGPSRRPSAGSPRTSTTTPSERVRALESPRGPLDRWQR